jgi:hypothetical protein
MKRVILASIFCLAFAVVSHAQDKPQLQLIPPQKLLEAPSQLGQDFGKNFERLAQVQTLLVELKGLALTQSGLCSVPLLEAHVDATDQGIAVAAGNAAVPIPQAHVPAPSCQKK